jgi:hypothetical protein
MRRLAVAALLCTGCLEARPKLVRELHNERVEVQSAESAELSYRSRTPELKPLMGGPRKELTESLGPGTCTPQDAGQRCTWRFSARGDVPLYLRVDFDAKDACTSAAWSETDAP